MKYLTQAEAAEVDERFFGGCGYTLEQLMEIAGLSVAQAVQKTFGDARKVLIVSGPGNNGGDGLVAARHLSYYGYEVSVLCPRLSKTPFLRTLIEQLNTHKIPVSETLNRDEMNSADVIVDAIFGYSFKPPVRGVFLEIIEAINASGKPVFCVDVPSGWDVEKGNTDGLGVANPAGVISLSGVKLCMRGYAGVHYLGGRFIPPAVVAEMGLEYPPYPGCDLIVRLDRPQSPSASSP